MGFRENLRRLREGKGWTQQEVAHQSGLPWRSIQNWEAGVREPRLSALKRLAETFGVSVDVLLEGIEPEEKAEGQTPEQSANPKPSRARSQKPAPAPVPRKPRGRPKKGE